MKPEIEKRVNLSSVNELSNWGLIYLTGEADPYGQRMLVDVNEQGKKILEQFFSCELVMQPNWNSSHGQKWSVLLPHSIKKELMLFILFHIEGCDCAYPSYNGFYGYKGEEYINRASTEFLNDVIWNTNRGKSNNTNQHQFSGRVQG
jgi:hypothetical protein